MKIRKLNNQNYINASGIWVRDFTKIDNNYFDVNKLINKDDYAIILENETHNNTYRLQELEIKRFNFKKIVILSDGFNFKNNLSLINDIPSDVALIATNGVLNQWTIKRTINFYIANNPYKEVLRYLPTKTRYFPACILSTRTHKDFSHNYNGMLFKYSPPPQKNFGMLRSGQSFYIDDYRNPICAAIALSYYFGVEKLLLFCCDEMYAENRDGCSKVGDHYMFPQQKLAHEIIDANLYWLVNKEENSVKTGHIGDTEYVNAPYITDIKEYFND